MRAFGAGFTVTVLLTSTLAGCRSADEDRARELCDEARELEATDPRAALELRRKVWEEMPTSGTPSAKRCGREVRERMGKVRALVAHDETGAPGAIEGCAWIAVAMEAFDGALHLPYRAHWARRLAERCLNVIGRAWTREPDSKRLADLNARLKQLAAEPED